MTRHASSSRLSALALALMVSCASSANAQTASLQQMIVGPPATYYGYSSAVDGDTAVVGAGGPYNSSSVGAVYVYVRSGATWSQQQRLVANDATINNGFGGSVAISGNTIIVGAQRAVTAGTSAGAAYVFVRNGNTWTQQAKLVASDAADLSYFGSAVDLDGNTAVVGAHGARSFTGNLYVFERSGATWTERRIVASDGRTGDNFGGAVGVSGDTICAGATGVDAAAGQNLGAVYVFTRTGEWALQQRLMASSGAATDQLGWSCAVGGNTVAAGANGASVGGLSRSGAVYVFTHTGTTWSAPQQLAGDYANAGLGSSTALAGDVIVTGALGDRSGEGGVYVFRRSGTTWTRAQRIGNDGRVAGGGFGYSVGTDGAAIAVGTPGGAAPALSTLSVYVLPVSQAGAPGAPTNLQASASGNALSMSWGAPTSGAAPTSYTLIARVTAGGAVLGTLPLGNVTSFAAAAPNGVFALSLTATNAAGTGPESAAVTVTLPSLSPPPGSPTGLTVSVLGSTATLAWTAPAAGGPVASYALAVGSTPGFAVPLGTLPLPAGSTTTVLPGIPPGTYYLRLLAQNAAGSSVASNEVTLTVAAPAAPGAPTLNAPTVTGTTVGLSWTPGSGGAPTSYVLTVLTTGGVVLGSAPLSGSSVSFPGVPSGSYVLRLVAVNSVGPSAASNTVTLVVP